MHFFWHWKLLHGDWWCAPIVMGKMHMTYKQAGFMQKKLVGRKRWRNLCWVWQLRVKADVQWLHQCSQFSPERKAKPFYFIFMGLHRQALGKHRFQRPFWLIFSYPWNTCGKDLWDSSFLTLSHHREGETKEPATIRCVSVSQKQCRGQIRGTKWKQML